MYYKIMHILSFFFASIYFLRTRYNRCNIFYFIDKIITGNFAYNSMLKKKNAYLINIDFLSSSLSSASIKKNISDQLSPLISNCEHYQFVE